MYAVYGPLLHVTKLYIYIYWEWGIFTCMPDIVVGVEKGRMRLEGVGNEFEWNVCASKKWKKRGA